MASRSRCCCRPASRRAGSGRARRRRGRCRRTRTPGDASSSRTARRVSRSAAPGAGADEVDGQRGAIPVGRAVTRLHWVTGRAGTQPRERPSGPSVSTESRVTLAAERRVQVEEQRLGLDGDGVHHQPAARPDHRQDGVQQRAVRTTADEHGVRRGQPGQGVGVHAADHLEPGDAEVPGVARDPGGPLAVPLDGDRPGTAHRAAPLDGHRTGAGPQVPEQLVGASGAAGRAPRRGRPAWTAGRRARTRRRAARAPGTVRVGLVGRAGDADHVQRGHLAVDPGGGERLAPGLGGRAEVPEHGDHAEPEPGLGQDRGDRRRAAGVTGQRDQAPSGSDEGADLLGALRGDPDDVERWPRPSPSGRRPGRPTRRPGACAPRRRRAGRRAWPPIPAPAGRRWPARRPGARRSPRGTRAAAAGAGWARGDVPAPRPRARGPGGAVAPSSTSAPPTRRRSPSPSPDHPTAGSPTTSTTTRSA